MLKKKIKMIVVLTITIFFFLPALLMVIIVGSGSNDGGEAIIDGITYVEKWTNGDAYTHNFLHQRYGITAEQIDGFIKSQGFNVDSRATGENFLKWQKTSGIDVRVLVAIAQMESGYGTAGVAKQFPHANLFGYGAFDRDPNNGANWTNERAVSNFRSYQIDTLGNTSFEIMDERAVQYKNGTLPPGKGIYYTDTSGTGKVRASVMETFNQYIDANGGTPKPPSNSSRGTIHNGEFAHIFNVPYTVIQPYGYTPWSMSSSMYAASGGKHTGVDVVADNPENEVPVLSITDGVVYSNSYSAGGGHAITIQPDFGGYLYYGHIKYASTIPVGSRVTKGQPIAILGHSGNTDIYHVHLEYSVSPWMGTNLGYDKDPSFLFQKSGTLVQNQRIIP